MRRFAAAFLALAVACSHSAADHEELGDRWYAAGTFRDALAEYQLGLKARSSPDLHAKAAAAALHTQDYALAAAEYRALAEQDRSRAGEAAVGLERVVRAALAASDRVALAGALAALQAVAPTRWREPATRAAPTRYCSCTAWRRRAPRTAAPRSRPSRV